jgi:hypothetical protein
MVPFQLHRRIPFVRRPFYQRDRAIAERLQVAAERDALSSERNSLIAERNALMAERDVLREQSVDLGSFVDRNAAVLQYRQAYYEVYGHVAPGAAIPSARSFPRPGACLSYKQKLIGLLNISGGKGTEIGPLNIPLLSKEEANVLYLDHLDTEGLRKKYPTLTDIAEVDRPMVNNSIADTLLSDAPLDYLVASQVFEHVPNPIRWLAEISKVLRIGGLLALSLPDRRLTFDFMREESRPSDVIASSFADATIPDVRAVYDNQSLAAYINMHWANQASIYPDDIVAGRGAVAPLKAALNHLEITKKAHEGEYLDAHCWVFTPPSFLLLMAQLAGDGFVPFRCHQFYPTDPHSTDRGSSSFTIILERVTDRSDQVKLRESFLLPLGEG